jgi:riboflavin synthase
MKDRMFTGIIEGLAEVKSISRIKNKSKSASIRISLDLGKLRKDLKIGDSVSVNGACLTVVKLYQQTADFDIIGETTRRTNLNLLKPADKVNIERSLRLGHRLEGHILLGHIDGVGTIEKIIKSETETKIWIKIENKQLLRSIVSKGSIAIDGISLTVIDAKYDKVSIALIPHTLAVTTLGLKSKGDKVNIETDILAKYVLNILPKKLYQPKI